jgi:hydrogenase maturation protease
MTSLLVIGYGNELRRDDGLGPAVARAVAARTRPGVTALAVPQLLPELAEAIAAAARVVFVDASAAGGAVRCDPLTGEAAPRLGHASDPRWLLALARGVYGARPPAWLLSVPAGDLGQGEGLSLLARRGVAEAVALIERLAEEGPA